jgi:ubiquinone/menaquinone biosynthesis C-methylase UbiE
MIEEAGRRNPDIEFTVGDMRSLDVGDATFAAVVAFYSLIHLAGSDLLAALREIGRVLRPQGILVAAFHQGSAAEHVEEWFGSSVSLDVFFVQRREIEEAIVEAGLKLERTIERAPYAGVEVETDRLYFIARRPS